MEAPKRLELPSANFEFEVTEDDLKIPKLLEAKRDGTELTANQISRLVKSVCDNTMEDAQLGAFLMSVFLKGMTNIEISLLTEAMKNSGTVFKWPCSWTVVDKHSTGGVGDKVSLVLAPALASCGLKVPMISGRGLGHTGGTLDKLESIPGFKVSLYENEMMAALKSVGCCIVGQTKTIVPADKRMYSIRDVTATVNSMPLIVSSIISKKACESLNSLILDVKFGSGSILKSQFEAESLAESLVSVGSSLGMNTTALVTSNEHPIGKKVGNALEVEEAISCMRGEGPDDLKNLVISLGGELLVSCGQCTSLAEGENLMEKVLQNGAALKTFSKMLEVQGVSESVCQELCGKIFTTSSLPESKMSTLLTSKDAGMIKEIDALSVAEVCFAMGAGRVSTTDSINYAAGMILLKVVGDEIKEGEPWAELRHDAPLDDSVMRKSENALTVVSQQHLVKEKKKDLVYKRIYSQNNRNIGRIKKIGDIKEY